MADTETSELLGALRGLEAEGVALRASMGTLRVDLSGRDWLPVEEAAFYCGVSVAQFNAKAPSLGLAPRNFMGKKLYEKAALHRAIHDASHWSGAGARGGAASPGSPAAAEAMARLARYERRKGLSPRRGE